MASKSRYEYKGYKIQGYWYWRKTWGSADYWEAQPMLCKSCSQDIIDKNTFRKPLLKDCKKEIDERIANEK